MFLIIESGYETVVRRRLSPTELLDCAHHAARYGRQIGYPVDVEHPSPPGLGADLDVSIQPTGKPGAVHVWQSQGFYYVQED